MKSKLPAMALALAVALGISVSSCAAPAPSGPAAPPAASQAAAQLPQAGGRAAPAAPEAAPTAEAPAPAVPAGPDYKSGYRKLLGGNVGDTNMVILTSPGKRGNIALKPGGYCTIAYGGTVKPVSATEYSYTYPFDPSDEYCPSGITFKMQSGAFDMKANAALAAANDSELQKQLEMYTVDTNFSGLSTPGKPPNLVGVVRVKNLAPISSTDKTHVFWSLCTVNDNSNNQFTGKIEVGKNALGTTIARFTTDKPRRGGECPSGTIFDPNSQVSDGLPRVYFDYWIDFK